MCKLNTVDLYEDTRKQKKVQFILLKYFKKTVNVVYVVII